MPDNKLAYEYPSEFGQIWDRVQNKRATRKNIALAVFRILKKEWYCEGINEQIREKNKYIKELMENQCYCDICGCTEMLCGHNKKD